jgi:tripartite-type tricarboxylate transporter receptor subunit TctC
LGRHSLLRTGQVQPAISPQTVHAPPDGYTLLLAGLSSAFNATVYKKLNFDFIRDIAPVRALAAAPM